MTAVMHAALAHKKQIAAGEQKQWASRDPSLSEGVLRGAQSHGHCCFDSRGLNCVRCMTGAH
jgi:hypothetical protein